MMKTPAAWKAIHCGRHQPSTPVSYFTQLTIHLHQLLPPPWHQTTVLCGRHRQGSSPSHHRRSQQPSPYYPAQQPTSSATKHSATIDTTQPLTIPLTIPQLSPIILTHNIPMNEPYTHKISNCEYIYWTKPYTYMYLYIYTYITIEWLFEWNLPYLHIYYYWMTFWMKSTLLFMID